MVYDRLAAALRESPPTPETVAFPDGSVDARYRLRDGARELSRAAFRNRLAAGAGSFRAAPLGVEPGGQAVNAARQAHALGAAVTLYGHLDGDAIGEPGLFDLPFETVSMGAPAEVDVYQFATDADGGRGGADSSERWSDAVMIAAPSADVERWGLASFRAVDGPAAVGRAPVAVCANWGSFPGLAAVLEAVAEASSGGLLVFDPGPLIEAPEESLDALSAALSALADERRVVLSANDDELAALARVGDGLAADRSAAGGGEASDGSAPREGDGGPELEAVRAAVGVDAVVRHDVDAGAVASADGDESVPNLDVRIQRATGGGDRFTGGLACALGAGWDWERALALGNACASRYLATGDTGDPAALADFVEGRDPG